MNFKHDSNDTLIIEDIHCKLNTICINRIIYIYETDGLTTFVTETENSVFESIKTIKNWKDKLQLYGFIKINHKTLINTIFISKAKIIKNRVLVFSDGREIKVSRSKWYILRNTN